MGFASIGGQVAGSPFVTVVKFAGEHHMVLR